MVALAKGEASSTSNPKLWLALQVEGRLTDPVSLTFQIFDRTTEEKQIAPVSIEGPTAVDLNTDRLGLGRYVASYVAPTTTGLYRIRWTWQLEAGGPSRTVDRDFEVLAGVVSSDPMYALVSDLRAEGVEGDSASDLRIQTALLFASRMIDRITGRFFSPRYSTYRFDGRHGRKLTMWDPIIALEELEIETELIEPIGTLVSINDVRIYNRHLSQNMTNPDDRNSPKIEFVELEGIPEARGLRFPSGVQNIKVTGLFGYTDFDGSPLGKTPDLIRHAAKLITLREIPTLTESGCRADARDGWRVTEERTRDQTVKYGSQAKWGQWIGDPEIDQILVMFMRPPDLGAT